MNGAGEHAQLIEGFFSVRKRKRLIGGRKSRFKIEVNVYICVSMPVCLRRANPSTFIF